MTDVFEVESPDGLEALGRLMYRDCRWLNG